MENEIKQKKNERCKIFCQHKNSWREMLKTASSWIHVPMVVVNECQCLTTAKKMCARIKKEQHILHNCASFELCQAYEGLLKQSTQRKTA